MNVCSGCWDDVTDVFVIETDDGPVVGLSSAAGDALTVRELITKLEKRGPTLEVQLHFDTGCLADIEGTFTNEDAFVLSDQDWFQG